tara:strand:+ start:1394 stop:1681 length:288 start_codon:yes stop_codon:yes gene_type:complete
MPKFNGHKNWNHWNVSLWLWNTESLSKRAEHYITRSKYTLDKAAECLLHDIISIPPFSGLGEGICLSGEYGQHAHTPDGAPYTITSIRAAIANIR